MSQGTPTLSHRGGTPQTPHTTKKQIVITTLKEVKFVLKYDEHVIHMMEESEKAREGVALRAQGFCCARNISTSKLSSKLDKT